MQEKSFFLCVFQYKSASFELQKNHFFTCTCSSECGVLFLILSSMFLSLSLSLSVSVSLSLYYSSLLYFVSVLLFCVDVSDSTKNKYSGLIAEQLVKGLSDNWSQVNNSIMLFKSCHLASLSISHSLTSFL